MIRAEPGSLPGQAMPNVVARWNDKRGVGVEEQHGVGFEDAPAVQDDDDKGGDRRRSVSRRTLEPKKEDQRESEP